jgi:GNAT superfamily N-acetyltransferase
MALATWWAFDPLPPLRPLSRFYVQTPDDDQLIASLSGISVQETQQRRAHGHRPYIAHLHGRPVAYGWSAHRTATIGELGLTFTLPPGNRYLWDFATLPAWQGRGVYPHLLRAILSQEWPDAERFWIIYAPENLPSGAGMHKAGFTIVGELSFQSDSRVALAPAGDAIRAEAGAALLGVALLDERLVPCWRCGGQSKASRPPGAACWPPANADTQPICYCATPVQPGEK